MYNPYVLLNLSAHKVSCCVVASLTVLTVFLALRVLYRRLYSARHSPHQARLVRFQIGLSVLGALLMAGFFLLWGLVISPSR